MRGLRLAVVSFVLAACTMLFTPSVAQAHDGWRHDRDRDDGRAHGRVVVRGDDGAFFFGSESDRRPPGWERGRKVGWGGCDLPPGQAKKYGCYRDDYRFRERRPSTVIIFSVR